jgi:hypothetical protein
MRIAVGVASLAFAALALALATLTAACSPVVDDMLPVVCFADSAANCHAGCASGDYAWPDGAVAFVCTSLASGPCPPPYYLYSRDAAPVLSAPGGPPCNAPNICLSSDQFVCLQDSGCTWACVTPVDAGH